MSQICQRHRMLLRREQVLDELQIDDGQLEELINSDQLAEIRIHGHRRFDSDQVYELAERFNCLRP